MTTDSPRVLVGGIFLEAHSFAPRKTQAEDFVVVEGEALIAKALASGTGLGGGVRYLHAAGASLIPTVSAVAPPGGLAEHSAYVLLRDRIVAAAERHRPDAVFLDLHGAMGTTELADTEGDIATALRKVLGPDVPIAASLDMHGNMTPAMLEATPLWISCKENPHSDYHLAGERAARLLLETLAGTIAPVAHAIWLPLLLPGKLGTGAGPLKEIHALRRQLEADLLDASIYNTYMFLDGAPSGQCVTTLSDGTAASAAVRRLAEDLWSRREQFGVDRPTLESVLASHRPGTGLLVLGDQGDRVLGGGSGDGTYILRHLIKTGSDLRALIPITDAAAVSAARAAGIGATVDIAVGGTIVATERPVAAAWKVRNLTDGRFVQEGPFLANEPADMGPTAVLQSGNCTLVVSSRPALSQDPQAFISTGENPEEYDLVVCKSGFHFEMAFKRRGRCVVVDTPGLTNYVSGYFTFQRRPPLWPEAPHIVPDLQVRCFPPSPLPSATKDVP